VVKEFRSWTVWHNTWSWQTDGRAFCDGVQCRA